MEYGRLGKTEPRSGSQREQPSNQRNSATSNCCLPARTSKWRLAIIVSLTLIMLSAVLAGVFVGLTKGSMRHSGGDLHRQKPTQAISRTCARTQYPTLCINSLLDFPGSLSASDSDLIHISVNMTLQHFGRALSTVSEINNLDMGPFDRSAYTDCLELLEDSVDLLTRALTSVASTDDSPLTPKQDVLTWLSSALTNQDTCSDALDELKANVKTEMQNRLKDLLELASNSLAIFSAAADGGNDFSDIPIQNRKLLGDSDSSEDSSEFPKWVNRDDRKLLDMPAGAIQADIVVSQDGNGTVKTIAEAIKKAPQHSPRRFVIYVKSGTYEEDNLKVGRKKTNLMFIGDGMGKTVIRGKKSVFDNMTTFHTATFAATGAGFIARDMSFVNYAGPEKHQAVALRVGADHGVVYRCSIIGYQDTLYVHSNRQFFRECSIYGTVDFIFGNAAVVIQNCSIFSRTPMDQQKNTITAQNRKDPNQNTGISIHNCEILPADDLKNVSGKFQSYLGRPWKLYSRTVYMQSYIGDHIHPRGWLEWNATFALDTLYYGEYQNYGPGAAIGQRVKWPGYRIITSEVEASRFTVGQFIYGSSWLPPTGVAFLAGLSG